MPYQPYQSGIYQQNLQQYQPSQFTGQQLMNQPQQLNQPAYQPQSDTIFVNGLNEVLGWVVQRGQAVRLWDSNEPKFYIKAVGDNGMPAPVEVYRYERENAPVSAPQTQTDYITRDEFESRLSELAKPQKATKKKEADNESDV